MPQPRSYRATGITLKSSPLGESDSLLTILTPERGLIRAVAHGARQPKAKIGGRARLFVINDLSIHQGRSLDRIQQAETIARYPRLSESLGKLAAAQYLSELALAQALSEQPQPELFAVLTEFLGEIERLEAAAGLAGLLAWLCAGSMRLLELAGVAPQVDRCAVSQEPILARPEDPAWRIGFSGAAGGVVELAALADDRLGEQDRPEAEDFLHRVATRSPARFTNPVTDPVTNPAPGRSVVGRSPGSAGARFSPLRLGGREYALLCWLRQGSATGSPRPFPNRPASPLPERAAHPPAAELAAWIHLERALRHYAQYHLGRAIRSAVLIDSLTASLL